MSSDEASEMEELIQAYLDEVLTDDQARRLHEMLKGDVSRLDAFIRSIDLHGALTTFRTGEAEKALLSKPVIPLSSGDEQKYASRKSDTRRMSRSTRSSTRRQVSERHSSWWVPALLAAGVLIVVAIFFASGPSEPGPAASQRAKEARTRASQEAEARRQSERDREVRERAQVLVEAEAKRLQAEARLRELEEKRKLLSQDKPAPSDPAADKEKREKELADLKRDQERIEQELRAAAELAKKAERPAPVGPSQGEKPPTAAAPTAPAPKQDESTKAAIAQVEEVSGEAFRVTAEGKVLLAPGAGVLAAEGLETEGGASRIVLRFPDKTQMELGPDTSANDFKVEKGKRLFVQNGTLRAVVAKQPYGQSMIVLTPHGQAKVVGTTFRLVVDPDPKKGTRLEVEEGKVELKNLAGKTVLVESGHYALAAEGVELVARALPSRKRPGAFVHRDAQRPWGAILQTVTLVPGKAYTLSVWIRTNLPDPATLPRPTGAFPGGKVGIRTESGAILSTRPFGPSPAYSQVTLEFTSGVTGKAVVFAGFANATNGDAFMMVDDWTLFEKGGDGENLIKEPDFTGGGWPRVWSFEGPNPGEMGVDPSAGRIPGRGTSQVDR